MQSNLLGKRVRPVDPNSKRQLQLAKRRQLLDSQESQVTALGELQAEAVPIVTDEQMEFAKQLLAKPVLPSPAFTPRPAAPVPLVPALLVRSITRSTLPTFLPDLGLM